MRAVVGTAALGVGAAVAVIHLIAQIFGLGAVADLTIRLLVPPLVVFLAVSTPASTPVPMRVPPVPGTVLLTHHRQGAQALAVFGLVMCWLGDLTDVVLVKLLLFLAGHIGFGVVFWLLRRRTGWFRPQARAAVLGGYLVVAVVMVTALAPHVGWLIGPMAVYAVCICAMAVLATGLGTAAALGGALFVASDALLSIEWFIAPFPGSDVLIMALYIAAQWLLTLAIASRLGGVRVMAGQGSTSVPRSSPRY